MSFTLATLKSTVQDYLQVNETTFNANLNTFIKEAESRIFKLVQLPEQRKNVTGRQSVSCYAVRFFCAIFVGRDQQ